MKRLIGLVALALGCNGPQPNVPANVVQDVTVGVDAAICALNHYATDVANGMAPLLIVEDIAVTCGIPVAKVTGILDAHKAAMAKEAARK